MRSLLFCFILFEEVALFSHRNRVVKKLINLLISIYMKLVIKIFHLVKI